MDNLVLGCERDGRGSSYSHRRQLIECFSNFHKGLRSFTEGNIEWSSRGYDLLIEGLLLKYPMFEGHDCFYSRKQVWVNPRGASVQSVCFS